MTAQLGVSLGVRTVQMIQVVLPDNVRSIFEVRGQLPGVFQNIIPLPVDELLQLLPEKPGVFNGVDFVLLMVINIDRWRWRCNLSRYLRFYIWNKFTGVENWVMCDHGFGPLE